MERPEENDCDDDGENVFEWLDVKDNDDDDDDNDDADNHHGIIHFDLDKQRDVGDERIHC